MAPPRQRKRCPKYPSVALMQMRTAVRTNVAYSAMSSQIPDDQVHERARENSQNDVLTSVMSVLGMSWALAQHFSENSPWLLC